MSKIVMFMKWEDTTLEQYEAVRKIVDWETDRPKGACFHVAAFDGNALRVTDIWESAGDFNNFIQTRLMPGVKKAGIFGLPQIEILPVHAMYVPDPNALI